jgi:hypothetical protein
MKRVSGRHLDFEIDKLTNSIENVITGDSFNTEVSVLTKTELKRLKITDWLFDWVKEAEDRTKTLYKLTISDNPKIIQGIISVEDRQDHLFLHLIESAKFNKGRQKVYLGVPGNLVAFACKLSRENGYSGVVSFFAKTKLIEHYVETLGAKVLFANQMLIDEKAANKLILKYFK